MFSVPAKPRIFLLETGHTPLDLFADAPEMDCFHAWAGTFPRGRWGEDTSALSRALRALQPGRFDLAVVDLREFCFLRRHTSLADGLFRLLKYSSRSPRELGHLLLFRKILQLGLPIAWINRADRGGVPDGSAWFFDRCHAAFIRELHPDPRMSFLDLKDIPLWSKRISGQKDSPHAHGVWPNKLFPLSLGWRENLPEKIPGDEPRTLDVFCAYRTADKPIRSRLNRELESFARANNLRVLITESLPKQEYDRHLRQSHLCVSPPGVGWDCWRHYEAMAAGCIPLLTYPTILRHQPPLEGVHAFYFAPEPGGLARGLEQALAARDHWREMGKAGWDLVQTHHSFPRLRSYLVATTLQLAKPSEN